MRPCAIACALTAIIALLPLRAAAHSSNEVLLRLLLVLRDRGSISAEEYEELRTAAEGARSEPHHEAAAAAGSPVLDLRRAGSPPPPVFQNTLAGTRPLLPIAPPIESRLRVQESQLAATAEKMEAPAAALSGADERMQQAAADGVREALAGKWYERVGFRGYAQFRMTNSSSGNEVPIEVPADRSVNENESLMIRRGRFIFSGDPTSHLALYAQSDFNASTGAPDYSLQMRDLYADIAFDEAKTWRARVGQSKVPFGFVNLQSSQNRAPLERPDALNSAVEGERDLGAYLMWAPARTRQLFRFLVNEGLKGSGDYGVISVGAFSGQGLNRSDMNGQLHWLARASYPFSLGNRQIVELGVQGYSGRYVVATQAATIDGASVTPSRWPGDGQIDRRVAFTAVWYPQPIGFEAEWNVGTGPALAGDGRSIKEAPLQGGYLQLHYRKGGSTGTWFPFTRWQYYDGGRKFARNAPRASVNEIDFGFEFARWAEVELTAMFTHTFRRVRTSSSPYLRARDGNRLALQVQWNY